MSWLRSAVYRAVGAGGRNNLTRIRSYASVVQQAGNAVAERAKFIQDRIVCRDYLFFLIFQDFRCRFLWWFEFDRCRCVLKARCEEFDELSTNGEEIGRRFRFE